MTWLTVFFWFDSLVFNRVGRVGRRKPMLFDFHVTDLATDCSKHPDQKVVAGVSFVVGRVCVCVFLCLIWM